MIRELAIFLIALGVIFTSIGGVMDMTGKDELRVTKKHFWNDGTYVTVLAVALLLLNKS